MPVIRRPRRLYLPHRPSTRPLRCAHRPPAAGPPDCEGRRAPHPPCLPARSAKAHVRTPTAPHSRPLLLPWFYLLRLLRPHPRHVSPMTLPAPQTRQAPAPRPWHLPGPLTRMLFPRRATVLISSFPSCLCSNVYPSLTPPPRCNPVRDRTTAPIPLSSFACSLLFTVLPAPDILRICSLTLSPVWDVASTRQGLGFYFVFPIHISSAQHSA